jgi:hypothetical protein
MTNFRSNYLEKSNIISQVGIPNNLFEAFGSIITVNIVPYLKDNGLDELILKI